MSEPIGNVDMANAWDGEEGDQWTQFADEFDTHFRSIWARFLETDPIAPADRVLDIGCGSGRSTRDAARLARDGSAIGVDLSESMLAEARRRAGTEGLATVEFTSFEEPLWFGADADAAYAFVGGIGIVKGLSEGLDEVARADAHEKLKAALRSHETPEGVRFGSAVWLIMARKP